jgi:hypothetical protein
MKLVYAVEKEINVHDTRKCTPTFEMSCERSRVSSVSSGGPLTPLIRWMKKFRPPGTKQPGHGIDGRPPVKAEIKKNVELYLHHMSSGRGAFLRTRTALLFNACATYIFDFVFTTIFSTL